MAITIYKVTITPFSVSGATQGGFLDNKLVQQYGLKPSLTFEQCQDKRRANLRWGDIIESLSLDANPIIQNISTPGATVDTAPTSFYFEVSFPEAGMPSTVRNGVTLTGIECVKQWIAEGMVTDASDQCEVFDPSLTSYPGVTPAIAVGPRFLILEIGKLAASIADAKSHISVTV